MICYPREIIARYHHVDGVLDNVTFNFRYGETMEGPFSRWFRKKKDEAEAFKNGESDPNVIRWLDGYIADLDKEIERYLIAEERGDYFP